MDADPEMCGRNDDEFPNLDSYGDVHPFFQLQILDYGRSSG